mmetsp:Transcript_8201/g.24183  ORF Transcript_8201/g.24183 Transcript_8201/m.24183 type:complete len:185 (-) Transcript_8201:408-962(-)
MSSPLDENWKQLQDLKDRVRTQWQWATDAVAPAVTAMKEMQATDDDNWLRKRVRTAREQVETAYGSGAAVVTAGTERVEQASATASAHLDGVKMQVLDVRRQYPGLVVAGVTFLAVAPAYRSGIRPLARNFLVGGSAAAFFLYPEFIARTAPYVDRASDSVSKHARSTAEKLGLMQLASKSEHE